MTKQIASIYYSELQPIRRPSYQGIFAIPVVKKGEKPALLTIKDHYENNDQPYFKGTGQNGKPFKVRETILGEQIADDVLAHWTKHHPEMTPQCAPGLWVVRDVVYLWDDEGKALIDADGRQEFRTATPEEKAAMFAEDLAAAQERQDAWCEAALVKGDIMSDNPKAVQWIPQYCRDSVDYAGQERTWRKGLKSGDVRNCIGCTKSISSQADTCPFCAAIVNVDKYAERKARETQALADATAKLAGRIPPPVKNPQMAAATR